MPLVYGRARCTGELVANAHSISLLGEGFKPSRAFELPGQADHIKHGAPEDLHERQHPAVTLVNTRTKVLHALRIIDPRETRCSHARHPMIQHYIDTTADAIGEGYTMCVA